MSIARRSFRALLMAACLVAAACAERAAPTAMPLEGRLPVLGPHLLFDPLHPPADWVAAGQLPVDPPGLATTRFQGIPAVQVIAGGRPFLLARRVNAGLLATPYLDWFWSVGPHAGGEHPVRLVIGFRGGDPRGGGSAADALRWAEPALPDHDRVLAIAWTRSALSRGDLRTDARPDGRMAGLATYVARGGVENTGRWLQETVDLAEIYQRAWPGDRVEKTTIAFIGLAAVERTGERPSALVSGLTLYR